MAKMTVCILNGKSIDIDEAIDIKAMGVKVAADFRCNECNNPVRPHRAGGYSAAHFEHLKRNPNCSKSHVIRKA
jgi:hypothetical protein